MWFVFLWLNILKKNKTDSRFEFHQISILNYLHRVKVRFLLTNNLCNPYIHCTGMYSHTLHKSPLCMLLHSIIKTVLQVSNNPLVEQDCASGAH